MTETTLPMMLKRREERALFQQDLIGRYHMSLISFSMNIAGPYKTDDYIECAFFTGLRRLLGKLAKEKVKPEFYRAFFLETGPEAFICVDCDPVSLKRWSVEIEDLSDLGRLFDIDIIGSDFHKTERKSLGYEERRCLLCNNEAKVCSSRRLHSVSELQKRTREIVQSSFVEDFVPYVASLAVKALLYEVSATPKPGLVDRNNSGSHPDMDFNLFLTGSSSLFAYFCRAFKLGFQEKDPKTCFAKLRKVGKEAENELFFNTHGVNTHKGAVFTMGILVCAAGIAGIEAWNRPEKIMAVCAEMTEGLVADDLKNGKEAKTKGERLFADRNVTGVRGEMESGLPSVKLGLSFLEELLSEGKSDDEASGLVLLKIMSEIRDTCLISRGGMEEEKKACLYAKEIIADKIHVKEKILKMDEYFIEKNLSPGGAADLLGACWFLHFLNEVINTIVGRNQDE